METRLERNMRFSERADRLSKACHACGAKALYRVYNADGEYFGACKAHKDSLQGLGPSSSYSDIASPAIAAIIDKGL